MNKLTKLSDKLIRRIEKKLCKHFGHRWLYKDYSNYIQANGTKYDFKASRNCTRCNEHAYFYTSWKVEKKSKTDYEGDYFGRRVIEINKVTYS